MSIINIQPHKNINKIKVEAVKIVLWDVKPVERLNQDFSPIERLNRVGYFFRDNSLNTPLLA